MQKITYGFYESAVGEMVLAKTDKGLCWLGFMVQGYKGNGLERMFEHFKGAQFTHDDDKISALGDEVIRLWRDGREDEITLDLQGTDFQKEVWRELMYIKRGQLRSYGAVANDMDKPDAARAVGSAVGENPVSLVVPCHRVVQASGGLGNYGWGVALKRRLLEEEGAL